MRLNRTILCFVEDPGAANTTIGLSEYLSELGFKLVLIATGSAVRQLVYLNISHRKFDGRQSASAIIEKFQPSAVVVGTSENTQSYGFTLIDEACRVGIVSIAIVDHPSNSAYRFCGLGNSPFTHKPDWLIVTDERTRLIYAEIGFPDKNILSLGHPMHDYLANSSVGGVPETRSSLRQRIFPDAADESVIVFATEISTGLDESYYSNSAKFSLRGTCGSTLRTHIVMEEFLLAIEQLDKRPYLVLRLHPKDQIDEYERFAKKFDLISQDQLPFEILKAADLVVGMTSAILDEAVLLGTETVSILTTIEEANWSIGISSGDISFAHRREEIFPMLQDALASSTQRPVVSSVGQASNNAARDIAQAIVNIAAPKSEAEPV